MRSFLWPIAALLVLPSCGGSDGPVPAPFGLDQRPSNTTCLARPRPVVNTGVKLQPMWSTLTFQEPLFLLQAPGDDRWFVVQREGKVRVFARDATDDSQVRDFATVTVNSAGEGGLLGMAFHPQWPTRREVYLYYTRTPVAGDPAPVCAAAPPPPPSGLVSILARFQSQDAGATLDATPDEILRVGQPFTNHKGGTIEFGLDGMLYLGLGDGGSGNDPCGSGQNKNSLLGKILRFDVNAPKGMYNVPADNPFAGVSGSRGEIWSYGHRNPFRWHFDRASGDLWVG
ncbi:MAG TPA: PQQ-dependent sugar dehydrogenase, partial [Kofleriaceae bacterium]